MHAAHPEFHDSGYLRTVVFNYMDNHRNKDRLNRSYKRWYPPSAGISKWSTCSESAVRNTLQRNAATSTKVTGGQSPKMIMEVVIEVSKAQWQHMRAAKTAGSSAAHDAFEHFPAIAITLDFTTHHDYNCNHDGACKKNKQKAANSSTNTMVQETPTKPQLNAKALAVAEQAAAASAKKQSTSASKADQGAGPGHMKTPVVAMKGGAAGARTSAAAKKAPAATTDEMDVDGPTAEIAAPVQDVAKVGTRQGQSSMGTDSTTLLSKWAKVGDGGNAGDGDHGGKGQKADSALVGMKGKGEGKGKGKGKGKDTGEANDDEVQSERKSEDEGSGKDDEDNDEDEDKDEAEDDKDNEEDDEREQCQDQDYEDGDGEDQSEHGKDVHV
ncbi:hypothetical protein FRC06_000905 [Ceratobasidium sp. 370]|nr:hypothetical protein FRC06_000905 [Ceratobasidium sp. 370]